MYVSVDSTAVVATDVRTGATVWTSQVASSFTPAESDRLLFVGAGADLRALDVLDGATAWTHTFPQPLTAAPVAVGGWVVAALSGSVGGPAGTVAALRASDGALMWQADLESPAHVPPTIAGSRIYVSTMGQVTVLDVASGAPVWTRRLGGRANELLVTEDRVYVGSADKYFYALDGTDGSVSWRWRTGGEVYGRPTADDARVYFIASDNVLRGLDRWSGAQRWKRVLPLRPLAGPVALGNTLLVAGTGQTLYAYAAKDGSPAGQLVTGGEVFSPPYVLGAMLPTVIVGTRDIAKGVGLTAFTRSIEPNVLPIAPLPNATQPRKLTEGEPQAPARTAERP